MPPEQKELFINPGQAEQYVETVREHYRKENAAFAGRRSEEQQLIAELTADEAREIVDGTMLGLLALGTIAGSSLGAEKLPEGYETEVKRAGFDWKDFRGEFERLLVGFGVITNRLNRGGFDVPGYADLPTKDRMKAASVLFGDFLAHNALRFGVDGSGVKSSRHKTEHTTDGGVIHKTIIVDKDKASSERMINENMAIRHYTHIKSAHAAGKISPPKYRELRMAYPEVDKDMFDFIVSNYTDAQKELESRE